MMFTLLFSFVATNETPRLLKAGIFAPIPSFFLPETEDLGTSHL